MSGEEQRRIEEQAREALDRSVETLPPGVRARLAEARREAIAGRGRAAPRGWLLPAGGLAAAALAAALWIALPGAGIPGGIEGDFELLLSEDSLDLVENLDFYLWLEEEGPHAG